MPALEAQRSTTAAIDITGLSRHFRRQGRGGRPDAYLAVANIDLTVWPGEFFCLLGPSGCGKSTILRMVAGFLPPSSGSIRVNGQPVRKPGADRGVVFQGDSSLFPWLTARENVEFGLRMRGLAPAARRPIADDYMRLVGLQGFEDHYPHELSGGMKQRIQIARVLANDPAILLMDEPFGALDAQTRWVMQDELQRIWSATRKTVLFITHDIEEAILLGDRVGVMTAGPAARIKVVHAVTLPRPRRAIGEAFLRLRETLRREIEVEVQQAMQEVSDGR